MAGTSATGINTANRHIKHEETSAWKITDGNAERTTQAQSLVMTGTYPVICFKQKNMANLDGTKTTE